MSEHSQHKQGGEPKPEGPEQRRHTEAALDEALEESFPASDPPSITQPPHTKDDKNDV